MEFRGQEPADEMGVGSAPPLAYAPSGNGSAAAAAPQAPAEVRYHECLRNHAAALGGHVVDGCGEFMPGGAGPGEDDGPLKCAACGCHRSFHRRDDGTGQRGRLLLPPAPPTPTTPGVPLLMPPPPHPHPYAAGHHPHAPPPPFPYHHHHHHIHTPSGSGGTTTESSSEERGPPAHPSASPQGAGHPRRKRFRTRFTPEQKEQMLAFADRVGWRMLKQDEALVDQFCAQVGVRRQVFKVWMHNNKHNSSSSRQAEQQQSQHQQQPQPQPQ